jgi:radical SAM protein with 4Fe4S-binding SPASM domain
LKCKYCFAACEPGKGESMGNEVMTRVITQMFTMPSKLITFELQGGEPLCYFEGMKTFVEIAESLKDQFNKIVKYRTVTNATMITDEFIEFAKKYDVAVCVSLDGDEEMTNQTRVYADGKGAFSEIIKGVHKLKQDYKIDGAVCTIGQHNMKYAKRIMEFFIDQGISFKPRPANILGREIENHTTTNSGEWANAFIEMHKLSENISIENYSVHIHEENVYGPVRDYICLRYPCGAAREVISVNPDGTVYPCDGFKNEESFNMGNIKSETLEEILSKEWVIKLRDRTYKDIEKCKTCMFRSMCCSCCYSAYGAYGTIYREDPQCVDRKKIFMYLIQTWLERNE